MKRIALTILFLLFSAGLWASSFSTPFYVSLREHHADLPLKFLPSDELRYFPGDPEAEYKRRFTGRFKSFSERYREARELEARGSYAEALVEFKRLDEQAVKEPESLGPFSSNFALALSLASEDDAVQTEGTTSLERLKGKAVELEAPLVRIPTRLRLSQLNEIADRLETFSPERLKDAEGLKLYLSLREAYEHHAAEDVSRVAKALSKREAWAGLVEYLELAHMEEPPKERLFLHLKKHPGARATWVLAFKGLDRKERSGYLAHILKHDPKSRYADDACLMLLRMQAESGDWAACQRSYQLLLREYADGDMVAQGRIHPVVSAVARLFGLEDLRQAYWGLAGGKGRFNPGTSALDGVDPFSVRSLAALDPVFRKRLLSSDLKGYELERLEARAGRLDEVFKRWDPEARQSFKELLDLIDKFLDQHPKHPAVLRLLGYAKTMADTPEDRSRLAAQIERCAGQQDVSNLLTRPRWSGRESLEFKDPVLREQAAILNRDDERLVREFPASPWALPAYMRLCHGAEEAQLPYLREFEKNYVGKWEKAVRLKLALALNRNADWTGSLELAAPLAKPGWELYDEALWLRSSCYERLSKEAEALAGYAELAAAFPETGEPSAVEAAFSWGQTYAQLERGSGRSPYGGLAAAKLAAGYEAQGRWSEAMEIYQRLGYRWDLAAMKDYVLPTKDWEAWLKAHPEEAGDTARGTTAMRYLRENKIDEALPLLEGSSLAEQKLGWDGPSLIDAVRELQTLVTVLARAKGAEARQAARYALGRFYFHAAGSLYINKPLWSGLYWMRGPQPEKLPEDPAWHIPYDHMGDAEYQFRMAWQEAPGGSMQDKAMYSQGLASAYGARLYAGEARSTSELFNRASEANPSSPLADDALFWSGHFSDLSKQAEVAQQLVQRFPLGDVVRFMSPGRLAEFLSDRWLYQGTDQEFGYVSHNRLLRESSEAGAKVQGKTGVDFLEAHFPEHLEQAQPAEGWLYYRNFEPKNAEGRLILKLEDPAGGRLEAGFEGMSRSAEANAELILDGGKWPASMTRWIWVRLQPRSLNFSLHHHLEGHSDTSLVFTAQPALKRQWRDLALPAGAECCGQRLGMDDRSRVWRLFTKGEGFCLGAYAADGSLDWELPLDWEAGVASMKRVFGKVRSSGSELAQWHLKPLKDGSLLWILHEIGLELKKGDRVGMRFVKGSQPQLLILKKDYVIPNLSNWPITAVGISEPDLKDVFGAGTRFDSDRSYESRVLAGTDAGGRSLYWTRYYDGNGPMLSVVDAEGNTPYRNRLLLPGEEGFADRKLDAAWAPRLKRWVFQGEARGSLKALDISWGAP